MTAFFSATRALVIAEVGGNHEGDFARARRLTALALSSGADAVKFQVYKGDRLASRVTAPDRNQHYTKLQLQDAEYVELARLCGDKFSASVWDEESLELIDPFVRFHKVGSGDLTNYPLLRRIAACDKPLIVSTAMATLDEVRATVDWIDSCNPSLRLRGDLCLMHCVAMYGDPRPEYAQLGAMAELQNNFPDLAIGYSDHTVGTLACEVAVALGARVIEKHFTDDPTGKYRDHAISATLTEMQLLMTRVLDISVLLGDGRKRPVSAVETEERIKSFRRGVYARTDLVAGTRLSAEHVATLRPLEGIDARRFDEVLGRRLRKTKRSHEPVCEDDLE